MRAKCGLVGVVALATLLMVVGCGQRAKAPIVGGFGYKLGDQIAPDARAEKDGGYTFDFVLSNNPPFESGWMMADEQHTVFHIEATGKRDDAVLSALEQKYGRPSFQTNFSGQTDIQWQDGKKQVVYVQWADGIRVEFDDRSVGDKFDSAQQSKFQRKVDDRANVLKKDL